MAGRNDGFAVIEMMIVFIIVCVMAATAVPQFFDLSRNSENPEIDEIGRKLTSTIQYAHALWLVKGATGAGRIDLGNGATVDMNKHGWPVGGASKAALSGGQAAQCVYIWENLLQNPPTIAIKADDATTEWTAWSSADKCVFEYSPDPKKLIVYTKTTGEVEVRS